MKNEHTTLNQWSDYRIDFLLQHTKAAQDVISNFVKLNWQSQDSDEANLDRFEDYQSEFAEAFYS